MDSLLWTQNEHDKIRVQHPSGISVCQEQQMVLLPDVLEEQEL
jgi:hypothetical protein